MNTARRMVYREALAAIGFATLAFLALFFFFDLVDELRWVNQSSTEGYQLVHALAYSATLSVATLYDLIPIAVLIGSVFVMARLATTSEFTVLRTSGLGPWRALRMMLGLGLMFALLTYAIGDFLVPLADRVGQSIRSAHARPAGFGKTGAWLKDRQEGRSFAVNVGAFLPDAGMRRLRLIEFDASGRLMATNEAQSARFDADEAWTLQDVVRTEFNPDATGEPRALQSRLSELRWPTTLSAEMVSVALVRPERMPIVDLFQFMRHLDANGQSSQRYAIEFWRKVFYPLSCLVMVVLALPFAYLHFRNSGISTFVFIGVLSGISFFLLNDMFGHFGNLRNWWPWLTAAAPGLISSLLSLSAFGWLVLRR